MSKTLKEGVKMYSAGMEGVGKLYEQLGSDIRPFFKKVFIDGVGEKTIDSISDGNILTFNSGYKAIDDIVVYEVTDGEKSVLTTVKNIDANNISSSTDLSAFNAGAKFRIAPIGLERIQYESYDEYKINSNTSFIVSDTKIGIKINDKILYLNTSKGFDYTESMLISKTSIITSVGGYVGVLKSGSVAAGNTYQELNAFSISDGSNIEEIENGDYIYPGGSASSAATIRESNVKTTSCVFSNVYIGKDRHEMQDILVSSSTIDIPDFVIYPGGDIYYKSMNVNDDMVITIGTNSVGSGIALSAKMEQLV